jgi:hypothetical protein
MGTICQRPLLTANGFFQFCDVVLITHKPIQPSLKGKRLNILIYFLLPT